ncbi:MAG: NmrA family NAD(P)-binding protein [Mucilaginibacter sp.]
MKVTITGSLGNISKPLAQELLKKGHTVSIISSNTERQAAIEAMGAKALIGSVANADFLATAFTGADVVYTMIPPDYTAPDPIAHYQTIGHSYAQGILQSGVKRVVHLSSWGAHIAKGTGIIAGSYHVERILNELPGVAVTHLRPCSFYNNLYAYMNMIKSAGFIGTNYGGDDRVVWVSPADIAAVAAEEIETSPGGTKIRYVASDECSCNEIARVLGAAIGIPALKWVTFTDEQTKAALEQRGLPALMAGLLVELNASIRSGLIRTDYDLHKPAALGKVKLADFAKEFAGAFKQN